jgi:hypothetical protein
VPQNSQDIRSPLNKAPGRCTGSASILDRLQKLIRAESIIPALFLCLNGGLFVTVQRTTI